MRKQAYKYEETDLKLTGNRDLKLTGNRPQTNRKPT